MSNQQPVLLTPEQAAKLSPWHICRFARLLRMSADAFEADRDQPVRSHADQLALLEGTATWYEEHDAEQLASVMRALAQVHACLPALWKEPSRSDSGDTLPHLPAYGFKVHGATNA